ncbi:MAG: T9SS type A sorting domain-containing protein, partial [Hymenobacter sp.]
LDQTSTYSPVITLAVACETADAVRLVPNPAASTVRLLGLRAGQRLQVYSSDGRLVFSNLAAATDQTLEISSWVPGLYLLHIRTADGLLTGTYKLLKQ